MKCLAGKRVVAREGRESPKWHTVARLAGLSHRYARNPIIQREKKKMVERMHKNGKKNRK